MTTLALATITILLFTHWLADFVFQTDWMAKSKSTSIPILVVHTLVYTLVFAAILLLLLGPSIPLIQFLLVNWIAHTLVDYITSRISKVLYTANDIHNFFVVIGFDQLLHAITLIGTAYYFQLL